MIFINIIIILILYLRIITWDSRKYGFFKWVIFSDSKFLIPDLNTIMFIMINLINLTLKSIK